MRQKLYATSISSEWDDTDEVSIIDPVLQGSNRVSIKGYMGIQFEEDATNAYGAAVNVFGRVDNTMKMFCGLALGITDLDDSGYPVNGSYDIAITSALASSVNSECDITLSDDMIGTTVNVVVTTPSDTTMYDKKASMSIEGDPYVLYLRYNSSYINIASTEKNDGGEYRTSILVDRSTNILRAEYISADTESLNSPIFIEFTVMKTLI